MKIPKGINVIECEDIKLSGHQDLVELNNWEDFIYLLSGYSTIFKLKRGYYILSSEVVYIYYEK